MSFSSGAVSIQRPVTNITDLHFKGLESRIFDRLSPDSPGIPRKFWQPIGALGLTLVFASEIINLQENLHRTLGITIDEEHNLAFRAHIESKLSAFHQTKTYLKFPPYQQKY